MAQRDRSQGFGFMYVNIAKVLEDREKLSAESTTPVSTSNVHVANFNKDQVKVATTPVAPVAAEKAAPAEGRKQAMTQIKENLDRLQSLHHRLHAMLDELNRISTKKTGIKE